MSVAQEGKGTTVAAALRHQRSIHVDAPVERVFEYLADPGHFVAGMAADHHASVVAVNRAQDGSVVSFDVKYREMGRDKRMVMTAEQHVPNRRIAYRSSAGPLHVFTLEPDTEGTTLSYGWDGPRLLKMLDAVFAHTNTDVEGALAIHKKGIECAR
ncbi:SRPBCC family protein [Ornithinimicrobium sediminis]|uniref:SRPBCC family protein n=1 Tax=Ornithinimicrobium sediminis TaxID=2904603 RepID=UPI001E2B5C22|nr:SRPBCC family protein [Ornithinimicrobium sediminis]